MFIVMMMMLSLLLLFQHVVFYCRSARSAAANVAGKFDYSDANDADVQAVSELQVAAGPLLHHPLR